MRPADILFEKLIQDGSIKNSVLIRVSQHRRSLFQSILHNRDLYNCGKDYYESYTNLTEEMKQEDSRLIKQPLFQWNNHGSTSWLYEKLNVEHVVADACFKKALKLESLKDRRNMLQEAIKYGKKCFGTLNEYHWEDTSLKYLPIFQERYHLCHIYKYASYYYKTVNDFSEKEKGESSGIAVKRAWEYMDVACNIWDAPEVVDDLFILKCKCLHQLASQLTDDLCGEKVALLKPVQNNKLTPVDVVNQYKLWKQQNDQVYFGKEETDKTLTSVSLMDLFHTLPNSSV